jgi:hypothetical protein
MCDKNPALPQPWGFRSDFQGRASVRTTYRAHAQMERPKRSRYPDLVAHFWLAPYKLIAHDPMCNEVASLHTAAR